jgi:hypothetical protein
MAATWTNVFVEVPSDTQVVWIVRLPYFDTPAQATYSEADAGFYWTASNAGTSFIPQAQIFKWRDV